LSFGFVNAEVSVPITDSTYDRIGRRNFFSRQ